MEPGEAIPRDRRLERAGEEADRDDLLVDVRQPQEGLPPAAARLSFDPRTARELERVAEERLRVEAARFEREHEDGGRAVAASARERLDRVEQPARCGLEAGLDDPPHAVGALEEGRERDGGGGAPLGPLLDAQPRVHDHAESSLRAAEEPVRVRPRAACRQAPRLDRAARRDDAETRDEVVHVGASGGEVAARARRDPAADRGVLERLGVVPERQAVSGELLLERRGRAFPPARGPLARPRRPRGRGRAAPGRG